MDFSTPKVVCGVCHGKGGFRKLKKDYLDTNWIDCPYCTGYGFVDDKATEQECREDLIYNKYRNNLVLEMQMLGNVKVCNLDYIKIYPYDRKDWTTMIKHLLKFANHNEKVNVDVKHCIALNDDDEISPCWEVYIHTHELQDIEGVIELLRFYNDTKKGSDNKNAKY